MLTHKLGIVALVLSTLLQAQQEETWFDRVVNLYWNGEYEQTLAVLVAVAPETLPDFERLEYYKYSGFSHMALGDLDAALEDFVGLLSTDPGYSFDPSMVSPKIIEHLETAKETVMKDLFNKGKTAYYEEDYETAVGFMDQILQMDPDYELAKEYKQLSEERVEPYGEDSFHRESGAPSGARYDELSRRRRKSYLPRDERDDPARTTTKDPSGIPSLRQPDQARRKSHHSDRHRKGWNGPRSKSATLGERSHRPSRYRGGATMAVSSSPPVRHTGSSHTSGGFKLRGQKIEPSARSPFSP